MAPALNRPGDEADLHCGVCDVRATSEEQLASHREGKRHARHLAMAELSTTLNPSPGPGAGEDSADAEALRCDLCQVVAPTPVHKEFHLRCVALIPTFCHRCAEKPEWRVCHGQISTAGVHCAACAPVT